MNIVNEIPKRRSGFYYDLPGQPAEVGYPSVTTILKVLAKPELDRWKAQLVARKTLETMDAEVGAKAPYSVMVTAGGEGSDAHKIIDDFWKGSSVVEKLPEKVQKYIDAFHKFNSDFSPKVIETEGLVYSNEHQYAGTYDGIFEINNEKWLIDWKTSNGVYWEYHIQIIAYSEALKEMGKEIDRVAIVQLKDNGEYDLVNVNRETNGNDLYKAFLSAKYLFDTKEILKNL